MFAPVTEMLRSVTSSNDDPLLKTQRARRRRRTRGQRFFSAFGRDGIDMRRPVEVESATAASASPRPPLRQVWRRRPASRRRGELSQRGSRYRQSLAGPLSRRIVFSGSGRCPSNPRPSAAPPTSGGRFMMTQPARSRWSTSLLATISAMISSASWTRLRPWKPNAKASADVRSDGSASGFKLTPSPVRGPPRAQ